MSPTETTIRELTGDDIPFLREMFVHTVFWREDVPARPLDELLSIPELARYIVGWGRSGDRGVVAVESSGERRGAAWYRLLDESAPGFGFVDRSIPELGIAVAPDHRGRGLGVALLTALVKLAESSGRRALSLSVDDENLRARRLYEALGFQPVGHVGTSTTMLLRFRPD
jgi:ribosomal protein S18 acetylase RimI-like enzyme